LKEFWCSFVRLKFANTTGELIPLFDSGESDLTLFNKLAFVGVSLAVTICEISNSLQFFDSLL
jgi:hypothetical protein